MNKTAKGIFYPGNPQFAIIQRLRGQLKDQDEEIKTLKTRLAQYDASQMHKVVRDIGSSLADMEVMAMSGIALTLGGQRYRGAGKRGDDWILERMNGYLKRLAGLSSQMSKDIVWTSCYYEGGCAELNPETRQCPDKKYLECQDLVKKTRSKAGTCDNSR